LPLPTAIDFCHFDKELKSAWLVGNLLSHGHPDNAKSGGLIQHKQRKTFAPFADDFVVGSTILVYSKSFQIIQT